MQLVHQHNNQTRELGTLPRGDDGIAATIAAMQAAIDYAVFVEPTKSRLLTLAYSLGAGTIVGKGFTTWAESPGITLSDFADSVWAWLRDHVRFERDPKGIEYIRSPRDLLDAIDTTGTAVGDCDDLATLGASIIAAAGLLPVLITVGRRASGRFEHVFFGLRHVQPDARLDVTDIIPLDPQEGTPPGEWPKIARRVRLWSLNPTPPQ